MNTKAVSLLGIGGLTLLLLAGSGRSTTTPERPDLATLEKKQAAATPQQVLDWLQHGNERFVSGKPEQRDMLHD